MIRAKKAASVINYILAVMLLAILVLQFVPFWSAEDAAVSIADYIWIPKEHKALTAAFNDFYADVLHVSVDFSMNHIYETHVTIFVCCIVGIALCFIRPCKWYTFFLIIYGGIAGAAGYAQSYIYQLGQFWAGHMILCIVIAAAGGAGLICAFLGSVKMD